MVRTIKLFFFLFIVSASSAQVIVDVDERINEELRMKNALVDTNKMAGFRIQVSFSADASIVKAARNRFSGYYPMYSSEVYLSYQQPYWKLRVGNYYREIDAQEDLIEIRKKFSDAFVVREHIKLPSKK